ncbi:hypothetical protein GOODEAATRI_026664 [Goodea atripinnis]|uniref:Uncharacterized protein n=1 Tax=Goodea atripinnis TaxID=208336 RepID=A0ABV0P800_9TELE
MGGEVSKNRKKKGPPTQRRFSQGFLSNVRVSITQRLGHSAVFSQPGEVDQMDVPKVLLPPEEEKTPPALISLFLPEFPQHKFPSEDCFQVLSVIAKGSLGPILKIKVVNQEKIWAVKVS